MPLKMRVFMEYVLAILLVSATANAHTTTAPGPDFHHPYLRPSSWNGRNPQPYGNGSSTSTSAAAYTTGTSAPQPLCPPPVNATLPASCAVRVDLDYSIYEGYKDDASGLNVFKGIRYAASTEGENRWRPPQPPALNRSNVISARRLPERCPQSSNNPYNFDPCPDIEDADTLPQRCANTSSFQSDIAGSEDCLFLSVYAPQKYGSPLPVLVWIHGGGYGQGAGDQDLTRIITANDNGFIGVAIQYRLGAFGFLASDEVHRFGSVNAGILDQQFALEWVQKYISRFGGDPDRVTIAGESAGGGAVMLLDMAYGGTQGDRLFTQTIAASPYLPMQYNYNDFIPAQAYYAFASKVGCFSGNPYGNRSQTVLQCLRTKDTLLLQQASAIVSGTGLYGTWGFVPVTDGDLIRERPSQQLLAGRVNGERALIGNNANEGAPFTPPTILTEDDFLGLIHSLFPLFTDGDVEMLERYYPSFGASGNSSAPLFATTGTGQPTALNQSQFATGQQQRADNMYAETTFICPSYWMADSYSGQRGKASYHYQYSVPPAFHGEDVPGYFGPSLQYLSPDFMYAFMKIWGNFVMNGNPAITSAIANGNSTNNDTFNPLSEWPSWLSDRPVQVNLNVTGGQPGWLEYNSSTLQVNLTIATDPGLMNDFSLADAYAWEGGRGERCDFWKSVSERVPE